LVSVLLAAAVMTVMMVAMTGGPVYAGQAKGQNDTNYGRDVNDNTRRRQERQMLLRRQQLREQQQWRRSFQQLARGGTNFRTVSIAVRHNKGQGL
jgi:hypothetical protein